MNKIKKQANFLFVVLAFISLMSISYALGEECCGDSYGGSSPLCTGSEVCMYGIYHWTVNSTDCASLGKGTCEVPTCNYCNISQGCVGNLISEWYDGTNNFTGFWRVYESADSFGSTVIGSPATNSSHAAACVFLLGTSSGTNIKSFIIDNLLSYTDVSQGYVNHTNSTAPINMGNTYYSLYWDFCPDGHTGSCSSGFGVTGDNYTSWMYYTAPDIYTRNWANATIIDAAVTQQVPALPLGGGDASDPANSGGSTGDIPEFSKIGLIVAFLVIIGLMLIILKKKQK